MIEKPVLFGRSCSLVGVASIPDETDRRLGAPAVIFLNAGILYRVGPNRLHVRLARALARNGIGSLRFDLGGVGDSKIGPGETGVVHDIVMRDVKDSVDWVLQENNCSGAVLFGLCAGADNALQWAVRDPRVLGAVLIDPNIHRSAKSVMRHYGSRLLSRKVWRMVLTGQHPAYRHLWSLMRGSAAESNKEEDNVFLAPTELPGRGDMEDQLRQVVDEGCRFLCVFTGESGTWYNHRDQFLESYPALRGSPHIDLEYFCGADHTFTQRDHQERLTETIVSWIDSAASWKGRIRKTREPES